MAPDLSTYTYGRRVEVILRPPGVAVEVVVGVQVLYFITS